MIVWSKKARERGLTIGKLASRKKEEEDGKEKSKTIVWSKKQAKEKADDQLVGK